MRLLLILCFGGFVLGLAPASAGAQQALVLRPLGKTAIRVDGELGEWRGAPFKVLGEDDGGALEYAFGYDTSALYIGARVRDDDFVRSRQPSPREDAVVLSLVMPDRAAEPQLTEVWLFPGVPGSIAASAAIARGRGAPDRSPAVTLVEAPLAGKSGYAFEARVPWSAVAGGAAFQVGRGAIRLHDVDGRAGSSPKQVASARAARPAGLPPLLCEGGANAAIEDFLRAKGLSNSSIRHDLWGDVSGGPQPERIVIAGTFAVIAGSEIEGGSGFTFTDLPVSMSSAVLGASLRELTGDDKAELTLRLRQQNELGTRELLQVLDLTARPRVLFALELRKQTEAGEVEAELAYGRASGSTPPAIEVRVGRARGLDADNYADRPERGVAPLLLPWGEVARRSYRWDGSSFAVVAEEPNASASRAAPERAAVDDRARDVPEPVVHGKPPGADELVAEFRRARGIESGRAPRFVQHANVAEDARIESLMLFGKDLLVIGKGYRGGTGYFFYGLPVEDAADVLRMFTGDVTGDGRRELFVRVRQRIADVQREILLGYTFTETGVREIVDVEVRRAQGAASVGNVVALVPHAGHYALRIEAGRAEGWGASNYPFTAESHDAHAPLLLPWAERARLYRFDGQRLVDAGAR